MRLVAAVVAIAMSATSCGGPALVAGAGTSRATAGGACDDDVEACGPGVESGALGSTGVQLVGVATLGLMSAAIGYWWRSRRR